MLKTYGQYRIWENQLSLPIGFLYHSYVSNTAFEQLNAAVMKDPLPFSIPTFPIEQLEAKQKNINSKNAQLKNAEWK
ncbi:hypothetical protein [Seinonella peptonophila]|uniref:hypothetical protein n=1 Tax=Seinonella peptonophila TaxID=112248 RepID=UPI0009331A88|nr:hypothetical protein [Seinonella peptonophila]